MSANTVLVLPFNVQTERKKRNKKNENSFPNIRIYIVRKIQYFDEWPHKLWTTKSFRLGKLSVYFTQ